MLLLSVKENNISCQCPWHHVSKMCQRVNAATPTKRPHCQCFTCFSVTKRHRLTGNCDLLLNHAKRIQTAKNQGPGLTIVTVMNVRGNILGAIDIMAGRAPLNNIMMPESKVNKGSIAHVTITVSIVDSKCTVMSVNTQDMSPDSALTAPRSIQWVAGQPMAHTAMQAVLWRPAATTPTTTSTSCASVRRTKGRHSKSVSATLCSGTLRRSPRSRVWLCER